MLNIHRDGRQEGVDHQEQVDKLGERDDSEKVIYKEGEVEGVGAVLVCQEEVGVGEEVLGDRALVAAPDGVPVCLGCLGPLAQGQALPCPGCSWPLCRSPMHHVSPPLADP